jgi:hypothetical protein
MAEMTRPPREPKCRHCKKRPPWMGRRGLCRTCYSDAAIRASYPAVRPGVGPRCLHCRARKAKGGCRGLCGLCHGRPEVRGRYPRRVNRWWERQESWAG